MVLLNPYLKIYILTLIEKKNISLFFFNLVPVNSKNEIYNKITSESTVKKTNKQNTFLVIQEILIRKEKSVGDIFQFLILV